IQLRCLEGPLLSGGSPGGQNAALLCVQVFDGGDQLHLPSHADRQGAEELGGAGGRRLSLCPQGAVLAGQPEEIVGEGAGALPGSDVAAGGPAWADPVPVSGGDEKRSGPLTVVSQSRAGGCEGGFRAAGPELVRRRRLSSARRRR